VGVDVVISDVNALPWAQHSLRIFLCLMMCRETIQCVSTICICAVVICAVVICAVVICAVVICAVAICAVAICAVVICAVVICAVVICAVAICAVAICAVPLFDGAGQTVTMNCVLQCSDDVAGGDLWPETVADPRS
jgi:hypothetical protein